MLRTFQMPLAWSMYKNVGLQLFIRCTEKTLTISGECAGYGVITYFVVLNSTENEIYPAHKVTMPTIDDILTFISMICTTCDSLNARKVFKY